MLKIFCINFHISKYILKPKSLNLTKILSPFLADHFPLLDKGSVITFCFHFLLPFKEPSSQLIRVHFKAIKLVNF